MSDLSLTVERTIKADPKDVFDAWLNPDLLRQFMMPAPGMSVARASTDPTEGGRFEIIMVADGTEIPHAGTYREIIPHHRIVFTWESAYSVDDSTVTLTFDAVDGGTRVTLTHVRFRDAETRDNHEGGWGSILETCAAKLAA